MAVILGTISTRKPLISLPSKMNLTVTATNHGYSANNTLNISLEVIDVNRDVPSFTADYLEFYLPDNSKKGEIVGNAKAISGSNDQLAYKFVDNSTTKLFNISKNVSRNFLSKIPNY